MPPVLRAPLITRGLLLLILAAGVYFFHGFLVPALAALIIGFATWPLYRRLVGRCSGNTTLAASLAILVVLAVLVVPLSVALHYAIREASEFVHWAIEANRHGATVPAWIEALPLVGAQLAELWREHLGQPHALGTWIQMLSGQHVGNISRTVLAAAGNL
ncbi:MAG: AI-2E family transporter, partial [Hydrogenophaga sp.]|nr:AI-2E family transporter [Hydrogenophaga sp.]